MRRASATGRVYDLCVNRLLIGTLVAALAVGIWWTTRDGPHAEPREPLPSVAEFVTSETCKQCHEDADKPEDILADRKWTYPAYSRRARRVVTLQQKINEMIKYKARGKELDTGGADIAALAAYVSSLRK